MDDLSSRFLHAVSGQVQGKVKEIVYGLFTENNN